MSEVWRVVDVLTILVKKQIVSIVNLKRKMFPFYRKKKTQSSSLKKRGGSADLIKRLDKVFACYIRLRDIMPNGMGKCISCGRIKPYREIDCGHFFGRTNMATLR